MGRVVKRADELLLLLLVLSRDVVRILLLLLLLLALGGSSGGRRLLCAIARVVKRADEGRDGVRAGGRPLCATAGVECGLVM